MASFSSIVSSLVTVAVIGVAGYFTYRTVMTPGAFRDPEVTGELVVERTKHGSWTTQLAGCRSGEHNGFYGVDLGDGEGLAIRIARDPVRGFTVLLRAPKSDKAAPLTPETCKGLVADVRRTNTTVNDVRLLDGDLALDCDLPGGGHARVKAHFEGCN